MGEVQLWQADGLGTDKETLEKVLRIFRSDGVQGIESQQALNRYIQKLDDNCIREMNWIDAEATLQMLVDCYGVTVAFQKYVKAEGFLNVLYANSQSLIESPCCPLSHTIQPFAPICKCSTK